MRSGSSSRSGLVVAVAVAVIGCHDIAKDETASLSTALERFRLADEAEKHSRIGDIERVKCTVDEVCKARDVCRSAAEELDKSNALRLAVKTRLSQVESGALAKDDPNAQALPGMLDESEALLKSSRAHMTDCDTRIAALQAAHR